MLWVDHEEQIQQTSIINNVEGTLPAVLHYYASYYLFFHEEYDAFPKYTHHLSLPCEFQQDIRLFL